MQFPLFAGISRRLLRSANRQADAMQTERKGSWKLANQNMDDVPQIIATPRPGHLRLSLQIHEQFQVVYIITRRNWQHHDEKTNTNIPRKKLGSLVFNAWAAENSQSEPKPNPENTSKSLTHSLSYMLINVERTLEKNSSPETAEMRNADFLAAG